MHIVVPMSGIGKRFIDAGYSVPKPLILVENRPIIAHVVDMFPGETKFTFICNEDHLRETNMKSVLEGLAPNANIISIEPHKKGPVYAVSQVYHLIDDDEEVIVNYCDFGKDWDFSKFKQDVRDQKADGAISAYRGFHPHMLGTINYAFMREKENWMLEIQEKKPFTNDRMSEYASDGTYYFRTGSILKKYFDLTMEKLLDVNGEFYVSVVYNLLVNDSLKVRIFEIEHMLQWGTPGELKEYEHWSSIFKNLALKSWTNQKKRNSINLIPMAGKGSRFAEKGFITPKPLLAVDGEAMVVHAAKCLPEAERNVFVCLKDHLDNYPIEKTLKSAFTNVSIVSLDKVTEGQAITAALGLEHENQETELFIAASDNGMLYDHAKLDKFLFDTKPDVMVFTFSNSPMMDRNPKMYGWVRKEGTNALSVSVKIPISETPSKDDAIVGAFYFKNARLYKTVLDQLMKDNDRVNGEFYIDTMVGTAIKMNLNVKVFPIDYYVCWGTPDDYHTYLYWQTFFRKTKWHPYK
ncbi:NTP transferase domain-containing protein [Leptospira ognonensis]|nr:NTP transferase domain-containing protein [Leptospira ognonensis]